MLENALSAFFNLHLRRGVRAVAINNPSILAQLASVFVGAEALGFTEPIIRGGAVRDALQGKEVNDYDLYVSRSQVVNGLDLPSIKAAEASKVYEEWLAARLGTADVEAPHRARVTERPYLSFKVCFTGIKRPVDLVINDEVLTPEMLALEADATMNGIAASRKRIVAHPHFLADLENHIYRPTCATIGNLISAPIRYRAKFAARDSQLRYRPF